MAEPLERRAKLFEEGVRSLVRIARWGTRERVLAIGAFTAFAVAAALPSGLSRLPKEWQATIPKAVQTWPPALLWLGGGLCFVLAALRIVRQVTAPLPQQGDPKLPTLKGAASFTPEDAELFARLGRSADFEQLRLWIRNDQTPLVVLKGDSGVGKTSLLRAGLTYALKRDSIEPIYWEALPNDPGAGLLHAVRTAWGKAKGAPANLAALPTAIAESHRVLVLDQLEQLSPELHPEIFDLLRDVLLTPPPYRGTWIVAFRRDFTDTWDDFTLDLPEAIRYRSEKLSLKPFSLESARHVVAVLAEEARLRIDHKVVKGLVEGLAEKGRVSPVDLGVTLLALGELAGVDGIAHLSLDDFRASGGPAGLLRRYLEQQLAFFSPTERSELLSALLAMIDLGRNQRRAEGLSFDELVAKVCPASAIRFEAALRFLASGKARILEIVAAPEQMPRYRLLHERFIEPVRLLSGTVLAAATQAALRLDEAYSLWLRNRRWRYLLSGLDLRLVRRYQWDFQWGEDEAGKRDFVRRSRRRRSIVQALVWATIVALLMLSRLVLHWQAQREAAVELRSWGLPEDLGDYLGQLRSLELGPTVKRLDWLDQASGLRSLIISAQLDSQTSLPPTLEEFSCFCSNAELLVLPPHLGKLRLIDASRLPTLPAGLQSLDLPVSLSAPGRFSLSDLPRGLTSLTVFIVPGSSFSGVPPRLKSLTIQGDSFWAGQLPSTLTELKIQNSRFYSMNLVPRGVTSLTLEGAGNPMSFNGVPPDLKSLALTYSNSLADLGSALDLHDIPRGLTSLKIEDRQFQRKILSQLDLREFGRLQDLDIRSLLISEIGLPKALRYLACDTRLVLNIPPAVERLVLNIGELSDLKRLPRALKSLELQGVVLHSWEGLPPSLQSLSLSLVRVEPPTRVELPQSLQTLELSQTPLALNALPPHLVSLVINEPSQGLRGRLPSTLRRLDLSQTRLERLSDLGDLPQHLEELSVPASLKSLRGLPKSVRVLRLRSR